MPPFSLAAWLEAMLGAPFDGCSKVRMPKKEEKCLLHMRATPKTRGPFCLEISWHVFDRFLLDMWLLLDSKDCFRMASDLI